MIVEIGIYESSKEDDQCNRHVCIMLLIILPYIIPEKMTIVDAASAPESLMIILVGAVIVLPVLIAYTIFSYYVFHGKATKISYD